MRFFECRPGTFVPASEITEISAGLVDCEKSRDLWCVRVRVGRENCPYQSKTFDSWEKAYALAHKLACQIALEAPITEFESC